MRGSADIGGFAARSGCNCELDVDLIVLHSSAHRRFGPMSFDCT